MMLITQFLFVVFLPDASSQAVYYLCSGRCVPVEYIVGQLSDSWIAVQGECRML